MPCAIPLCNILEVTTHGSGEQISVAGVRRGQAGRKVGVAIKGNTGTILVMTERVCLDCGGGDRSRARANTAQNWRRARTRMSTARQGQSEQDQWIVWKSNPGCDHSPQLRKVLPAGKLRV